MITRLCVVMAVLLSVLPSSVAHAEVPEVPRVSSAGVASTAALPAVNLNSASVEELCTLPGIGPKKAEAIVALRTRRPLTRVTQLLQVKGIGPKTLQRLKPRLTVAPPVASPASPASTSGSGTGLFGSVGVSSKS
jgi:competence protein ComEA